MGFNLKKKKSQNLLGRKIWPKASDFFFYRNLFIIVTDNSSQNYLTSQDTDMPSRGMIETDPKPERSCG